MDDGVQIKEIEGASLLGSGTEVKAEPAEVRIFEELKYILPNLDELGT